MGCFPHPGIVSLQVELNGQAGTKRFFMARDYYPLHPGSILHDLRLLPNRKEKRRKMRRGREGEREEKETKQNAN